ncbi:glutamine-hydrolyzing carbamoyl-phosphate synthase small subunit [Nannocystis punicea]|uniref:Carbamoyl phosphate synthase small chain n=1 Tax=Nannocystis punicea TaxID=2995304 RepID=A0ABY7HJ37_9BACT|nr:glutamine-hydrolyzing carbamoyl-phosphate synthase small subunit [Nannocystis poenicansa]WAS99371.1 glutamine-hydrolyzing carbamoyl-phosphate synthase small subunit [Nannocystis poenicansa]
MAAALSRIDPPSTPGLLALADGTLFRGRALGAEGRTCGEVVFNTAMTGYQEVVTDPSYHQQIVTLTAAHVGVVGVNPDDEEGRGPQVAGLVVRDAPRLFASWRGRESLAAYLRRTGVVAVSEIDTRRLTHLLRERGAMAGCVAAGEAARDEAACVAAARAFPGLQGAALAEAVSVPEPAGWSAGSVRWLEGHALEGMSKETGLEGQVRWGMSPGAAGHVVAFDFGVKRNILRLLVDRGLRVTVVPAATTAAQALALRPDGIFLSNGPGDPEPLQAQQAAIRELVASGLPVFGICLGHQLLCLALGARTFKMKFGHHGANHPVRELATGRVLITSQNHGFAADPATLPAELRATHVSLFDGSLQGVELAGRPVFSFQGHPEASPGPRELAGLFDRFAREVVAGRAARRV